MKRVLVIANNLAQASFRMRIAALVTPLRDRGIALEIQVRPRGMLARRRLLKTAKGYDSVILQRKFLDPGDARLLRRCAKRIFYDIDDALMVDHGSPGLIARWRNRRRYQATTRIIDHVIAGNEHLAEVFRDQGKPTTVIPTVVDPARYLLKQHSASAGLTLVWIGSQSTLPYVEECLPALEEAARRVPGLRLTIMADKTLKSESLAINFIPWSAATEAAALLQGDIGIAPTPDTSWTRGKCGFKIIQYMAAGLPVIASPIGANAEIVQTGETGLLPRDYGSWADAIAQFAGDVDLRARMGMAGRQRVESIYSIDRAADAWAKLLNGTEQNGERRAQ